LAFDVGSETLPALSLSRDPAEPDIMQRPPRPRDEGVIRVPMLLRAWLFLGMMVAGLAAVGYFYVLVKAGWRPGVSVDAGTPFYHAYRQATTMTFLGMITGQIGTAFAVRTQRASLWSVGVFSNRYLLGGVAAEIALAAAFVYVPVAQSVLETEAPAPTDLLVLLPFPFIVWGTDELRKYLLRRRRKRLSAP
jgi:magnesium-transporting ATPase (P-type)